MENSVQRTKRICGEIMDYCEKESNYSYYDMKSYALKNKPEWIEFLHKRSNAKLIACYLKSAKSSKGIAYKDSFSDAFGRYVEEVVQSREKE